MIEIPAGKIDAGEIRSRRPGASSWRRLATTAAQWRHVRRSTSRSRIRNERIEIYLAKGLRQEGAKLDDEEFLEVFTLPLATALAWVREGKITDSKPCPACLGGEGPQRGGGDAPSRNLKTVAQLHPGFARVSSPARAPPRGMPFYDAGELRVGIPDVPVMRPRGRSPSGPFPA